MPPLAATSSPCRRRARGGVLAALIALPALLALAGPASAEGATKKDPGDDVYVSTDGGGFRAYGRRTPNSDIRSTRVVHSSSRISMTMRYESLAKRSTDQITSYLKVRDQDDVIYYLYLVAEGATGSKTAYVADEDFTTLSCHGVHRSLSWGKTARVTISAPRSCLGSPSYIGWRSYSYLTRTTESHSYSFYDSGIRRGLDAGGYEPTLAPG